MTGRVMLPAIGCPRWSASRKQAVVIAIRCGQLSYTGACERYGLSLEELGAWMSGALYATKPDRVVPLAKQQPLGGFPGRLTL